jgi:transcriptional regulator with XRE-family HTH domain
MGMNLEDYRKQLMQDPEVAAAQARLQPRLDLARQVLHLRLERGWTQQELAERAGTKQANISRLENAKLNPSVEMLQKIADAFGAELAVTFVPSADEQSTRTRVGQTPVAAAS